jgi:hypothetical protein
LAEKRDDGLVDHLVVWMETLTVRKRERPKAVLMAAYLALSSVVR